MEQYLSPIPPMIKWDTAKISFQSLERGHGVTGPNLVLNFIWNL